MNRKSDRTRLRILLGAMIIGLATAVAGCGDKAEDEAAATATNSKAVTAKAPPAEPAATAGDANAGAPETRMASALVTSKTAAAVDLEYDILSRPDVAQPFAIELAFRPRVAADALEVEVTGMTGLVVENGANLRFERVEAGSSHAVRVQVRADGAGLYYLGIAATLVTAGHADKRSFAVPVAVGVVAAREKSAPPADETGMPVQSMPATEPARGNP